MSDGLHIKDLVRLVRWVYTNLSCLVALSVELLVLVSLVLQCHVQTSVLQLHAM